MECLLKDKCSGREWGCVYTLHYFCQQRTPKALSESLSEMQLIYEGLHEMDATGTRREKALNPDLGYIGWRNWRVSYLNFNLLKTACYLKDGSKNL